MHLHIYLLLLFLLQASTAAYSQDLPYNLLLADHTAGKYMILSRSGELVWERPGRGLFEAWALEDGSLLLADRDRVQRVIPAINNETEDKVVWTYKYGSGKDLSKSPKGMIYSCTPLKNGNILVTESGTYRMVELNARGKIVKWIKLPPPVEENQQSLRFARKTDTGSYLVCYMFDGKILELSNSGKLLRSIDVSTFIEEPGPSAYEAIPIDGGRILVSLGPSNKVIILNANNEVEWELSPGDLPDDWNFSWITRVVPLENGNLIICNYCKGNADVKAFEITPGKEIVWALRDQRARGLTSLQRLTDDFKGMDLPVPVRKRQDALSSYKELKGLEILCVKRGWPGKNTINKKFGVKETLNSLGLPTNHTSNSSTPRNGYENEIGTYNITTGQYRTLFKPEGGYFVGHLNLHWDADRFLFTLANEENWEIFEMNIDGTGLRKISSTPQDVDSYEPCYLPDGRIVFESNAAMQGVPCWHGKGDKYIANLFIMNPDGSGMRRLTFDQDHDSQPVIRNNGQVVYSRWDYTGINRVFNRPVMSMNPDGTNQRSIYGSNSYYPNGVYSLSELPGRHGEYLGIVAGYHGSNRSGVLALLDFNRGTREDEGLVLQISGTSSKLPIKHVDLYTAFNWPEFMTPAPVTDQLFLASAWMDGGEKKIGIYLADRDDRLIQLFEEPNTALLEPTPIIRRPVPPMIPDRVNLDRNDATVYIQDIYSGPGLRDVPRGTVRSIRVIAYDFGYDDLSGQNKIGLGGPWDAMRILGTTTIENDGSAIFKVPANTPIALQPLDEEGKAVQLMRSWMTAMPGEVLSCVGCHESSSEVPLPKRTIASSKGPSALDDWYGPQRGFDFEREVQPVLDRYCVRCHNEDHDLDLRREDLVEDYRGSIPGRLDYQRLHPDLRKKHGGRILYTPAYEALLPYVRRVNVADTVALLDPGEYHADTSELIQLLQQGHKGIMMDSESWSRLITWIDLNAPCHGTWKDVFNQDTPCCSTARRRELAEMYGSSAIDPEFIPVTPPYDTTPVTFHEQSRKQPVLLRKLSPSGEVKRKTIPIGNAPDIDLVKIDDHLWMGACEITNAQFAQFDPDHSSRFYWKRQLDKDPDDKGIPMGLPDQPVQRVSWNRAIAFCDWLSQRTGLNVTLPTEQEWMTACLAGGNADFHYASEDFSKFANLADASFATIGVVIEENVKYVPLASGADLVIAEGVDLADTRFDDGAVVPQPVGSYFPNSLGLHDMHGNVAEWTTTPSSKSEMIVKGGSFLDRPERATATTRLAYPAWQNVYNTGFRIVVRN